MSTTRPRALWSSALASAATVFASSWDASAQDSCFERIDNGVNMTGWRKSTTNQHGPGNGWTIEDGAFVGRQTAQQQGGILMTDQSYGDVEAVFEVKIDWGCDSGFFFRTTEGNRAYQVTIDHLAESAVGTIWGEAFSQELREIPYWLTDDGNAAIVAPGQNKTPIFDLAKWSTIWDPTDFNEVRARIEGNPPHIQIWIAGTRVMDFTDTMTRSEVNAVGPLAIQVHSGSRWIEGGTVAFRNIRVRDLSVPCLEPGTGGAGGGAGAASGGSGAGGGDPPGRGGVPGGSSGALGNGGSPGLAGSPNAGGPAAGGASAGVGGGNAGVGGASAGALGSAGGASIPGGASAVGDGAGRAGAPAAATSGGDSGCGCRITRRDDSAAWLLVAMLGLAARQARRARGRSPVGPDETAQPFSDTGARRSPVDSADSDPRAEAWQ